MARFTVWIGFAVAAVSTLVLVVVDPWVGWTLVVILVAVAAGQFWGRAAARRRVEDGMWRVRIWAWRELLVGQARFGLGWTSQSATVDLRPRAEGLVLTPTRGARLLGHRERTVPWVDVVSATVRAPSHGTPDGRMSFTPQTPIEIAFTGDLVPPMLRPDGEHADAAPRPGEPYGAAERYLSRFRAWAGDDAIPGTLPVILTSDAPDGLDAALRARARGVPLPLPR